MSNNSFIRGPSSDAHGELVSFHLTVQSHVEVRKAWDQSGGSPSTQHPGETGARGLAQGPNAARIPLAAT